MKTILVFTLFFNGALTDVTKVKFNSDTDCLAAKTKIEQEYIAAQKSGGPQPMAYCITVPEEKVQDELKAKLVVPPDGDSVKSKDGPKDKHLANDPTRGAGDRNSHKVKGQDKQG